MEGRGPREQGAGHVINALCLDCGKKRDLQGLKLTVCNASSCPSLPVGFAVDIFLFSTQFSWKTASWGRYHWVYILDKNSALIFERLSGIFFQNYCSCHSGVRYRNQEQVRNRKLELGPEAARHNYFFLLEFYHYFVLPVFFLKFLSRSKCVVFSQFSRGNQTSGRDLEQRNDTTCFAWTSVWFFPQVFCPPSLSPQFRDDYASDDIRVGDFVRGKRQRPPAGSAAFCHVRKRSASSVRVVA